MRAILESYDSELATSEYSPQLMLRVKEAEDMLQKVQTHNTDMEVRTTYYITHNAPIVICSSVCNLDICRLQLWV